MPTLAKAGYWAPPQDSEPALLPRQSGDATSGTAVHPSATPSSPQSQCHSPGSQALAPASHPPAVSFDAHANRRLQAADLAAFLGSGAVLGSLFMAWYQFAFTASGISISVSITALASPAGGWRWSILGLSVAVLLEVLLSWLAEHANTNWSWPHQGVLALLCGANLVLVIAAMVASPFSDVGSVGLLQASLGSGAFVALAGAVVSMGAAVVRLFSGPPALAR